ncbi:hypothetical protein ABXS71_17030 [Bacillus infantis]|uniref:hypothetical protein n=1 Tax=Bacillus infantis TaxID=324767 RepID=UPI00344F9C0D
MEVLKRHKMKFLFIFVLTIVFIGIILAIIKSSNPVNASPEIYDDSLALYKMINKAYENNRVLNNVERIKIQEYSNKAEKWKKEISNDEKLTKTDEVDLRIMTDIEIMANWYEFQADAGMFQNESVENFLEYYNASKKSLGLIK